MLRTSGFVDDVMFLLNGTRFTFAVVTGCQTASLHCARGRSLLSAIVLFDVSSELCKKTKCDLFFSLVSHLLLFWIVVIALMATYCLVNT